MRFENFLHLFCLVLVFTVSCKSHVTESNNADNKEHASRFQITDCDGYKKLVVSNPWQESSQRRFTYYLFSDSLKVPDSLPLKQVIHIPVKRIVCMSTTHLAMVKALDESGSIVGISGKNLIFDAGLKEKINEGLIPDVGYESNLDKELVVSLKPDVLMAYGIDPSSSGYFAKLSEMGISVMYNADYLEETPLARAEWIKVFGALFNKEREADSIYNSLVISYERICDSVINAAKPKPKVLSGGPWEDVWYIAPANSYAMRLITDAGGYYLYNDLIAANAQPYSVESVFVKALDADVWINPGSAKSLEELFNYDYRLKNLPVCSQGAVFSSNKRLSPDGGNDYFESAVIHPDVLLRDLASAFNPELYPGYVQKYYRKLQ